MLPIMARPATTATGLRSPGFPDLVIPANTAIHPDFGPLPGDPRTIEPDPGVRREDGQWLAPAMKNRLHRDRHD